MTSEKINLMSMSPQELSEFFVSMGEKSFRAQQIMRWIYQFGVTDFDEMSNLNKVLRAKLKETCVVTAPEIVTEQKASDGTTKWALDIGDGQLVETVLIPEADRNTLCISTQVGCPVKCAFCRTGAQGFNRNLTVNEIIGQVFRAATRVGFSKNEEYKPISNVVMMGMGEPLLNLQNVMKVCDLLLSDYGFALSKRRVTVSTSGVAPVLNKIAGKLDVALALSLHAPDYELRNKLVPINENYNIKEVLDSVRNYIDKSNANCGRVTIEYVLLDHVNDSTEQAEALVKLLRTIPCKVNLIPFNEHENSEFRKPSNSRIDRFYKVLFDAGFTVIKRTTRGDEISAACGQLAGQVKDKLNKQKEIESVQV